MTYAWEHLIDAAWDRFVAKIDASDPLGCWLWTGAQSMGYGNWTPYGTFWVGEGHAVRAHAFSCAAAGIEVPPGYHRDHLCHRPLCVNPLHLEPVEPLENNRRKRRR